MDAKNVIPYQEFKQLKKERKKELLVQYEKEMSIAELARIWGTHVNNVYGVRSTLGISKQYKQKNNKKPKKEEQKPNRLDEALHSTLSRFKSQNTEVKEDVKKVDQPLLKIERLENKIDYLFSSLKSDIKRLNGQPEEQQTNGINFVFKGKFSSKQLTKKLEKVLLLIDEEHSEFEIDFKLKEREKKEVIEVEEEGSVDQNKIEELREELKSEFVDIVDDLKTELKSLQGDLNEKIKLEQKYADGYSALKSDKQGLHKPKSEFESAKKKQLSRV